VEVEGQNQHNSNQPGFGLPASLQPFSKLRRSEGRSSANLDSSDHRAPLSIKPATPVIYTFGNRPQMKGIDKYANIGIYKPNGEQWEHPSAARA